MEQPESNLVNGNHFNVHITLVTLRIAFEVITIRAFETPVAHLCLLLGPPILPPPISLPLH